MSYISGEYLGNLRISVVHAPSNTTIITDPPIDNGGQGTSFSPSDLVATALATCALGTMGKYADEHGFDISGSSLTVSKEMAKSPSRIASIHVTLTVPDRNYSEKDKIRLENACRACTIHKSLHPDLIQNFTFVWL